MKSRKGFTLLELVIVIMVIGILGTLLIPRLPDISASKLKSASRKMAGTISYLYDRSAARQVVLRMTLDLDKNEYYVSLLNTENQFEETTFTLARRTRLKNTLKVRDARTATQGIVSKGKAFIHFFPGGFTEMTVIHLIDQAENEMTLVTSPLTGKVKIYKGYVDVKQKAA